MGQNEEMAWLEQLRYWEDKREILEIESSYWNMKLEMLTSEREHIANKRRGW